MRRVIKASNQPKSYEYNGYRIYDNGSGFEVYTCGKRVSGEFVTSEEAEEYVDNLSYYVSATSNMKGDSRHMAKRKFVKRPVTAATNKNGNRVAQVRFDLIHDGNYELPEIEAVLVKAGYNVIGIDSEDITSEYSPADIENLSASTKVVASESSEYGLEEFVKDIINTRLPRPEGTNWTYSIEEDMYGGDVAELYLEDSSYDTLFAYSISDWNPDTDELVDFTDADTVDEIMDDLMIHYKQTANV